MSEATQVLEQTTAPVAPQSPETSEPSQELTAPLPKPEDRVSSKLDILLKREQSAIARERAAKDSETKLSELQKKLDEFEQIKSNPKRALEALGISYDQLTQSILKDGEIPVDVQIKRIEEKFDGFKSEQQKAEEKRQEDLKVQAKAQEERAVKEFKGEISNYLKEHSTRYELTAFEQQEDLIYDVIEEHYARTMDETTGVGKVLTIAEASDKVEQYLEQKELKRKELSKVKSLWSAVPKGLAQEAVKQSLQKSISEKPKTLTNQMSASPSPKPSRDLSDQELKNRAIEYAKALMAKRQS